ncbi:hypothetical protein BH20CHL7_BH20CHL7_18530 [soil metagenome]
MDASALLKRYVEEEESEAAATILADGPWASGAHLYPEVRIALARRLAASELAIAVARFERDWQAVQVIALDASLPRRAAHLGIGHRLRTLDALHLAAAERAGGAELTFVTFDERLAVAARAMRWPVAGV